MVALEEKSQAQSHIARSLETLNEPNITEIHLLVVEVFQKAKELMSL